MSTQGTRPSFQRGHGGAASHSWLKCAAFCFLALWLADTAAEGQPNDLVAAAEEGQFTATGLYDPVIHQLDNGLTVIVKRRTGLRGVAVRAAIDLGAVHYPCDQKQTPHFLEHMLYGAVPDMTEAELERRFFELGAYSNAYTSISRTVFELDVFEGTLKEGLNLTASMLTDARLREESFKKTQAIIYRESGGEPSKLEASIESGGHLASGFRKAAMDAGGEYFGLCGERDTGSDTTFEQVQTAFENYYTPERMTWVVVGDVQAKAVIDWAQQRLGELPRGDEDLPALPELKSYPKSEYLGFAPEPGVAVLTRTVGMGEDGFAAEDLLVHLLNNQLYRSLRLEAALTYTPQVYVERFRDFGYFVIEADADPSSQDEALGIIKTLLQSLADEPLPAETLRTAKLSLLRQWAQAIETNSGYAGYYVGSLPELHKYGHLVHEELALAKVSAEDFQDAAKRLFGSGTHVVIRDKDRRREISAKDATDG